MKGACAVVFGLARAEAGAAAAADALAAQGYRVLAVAAGPEAAMRLAGLIALSDPPRPIRRLWWPNCARLACVPSW